MTDSEATPSNPTPSEAISASGAVASAQEVFADQIFDALRSHNALPYLFIGSGMSIRYLGLPDWEGMLRRFADEIGEDLDFMLASTSGDLPAAAALLAGQFHEQWWKHRRYSKQRAQHKKQVRDPEAALKVAIATFFSERSALAPGVPGVDNPDLVREIELLRESVVDGVITTNFDDLTDDIFPGYVAYVGQEELVLSDAQFVAETYKIHGSCHDPASLVVTTSDYEAYQARNAYLAAKLLTIFAEHPVIFLGYSLGDAYIRDIIAAIAAAVGPARLDRLRDQIYFVEWNPDATAPPTLTEYFLDFDGVSLPALKISTHSFTPVFDALTRLQRPFPARVLRELSKHVYDLVAHPAPDQARETVRSIPFDSDGADGLRVVFGVGTYTDQQLQQIAEIGARALTREDLAADVLELRDRPLDGVNALRVVLPQILKYSGNAYLPVFKYLADAGLLEGGKLKTAGLDDSVKQLIKRAAAPSAEIQGRFKRDVQGTYATPRPLMDSELPLYFKLESLLCLDAGDYNLDELRDVLVEVFRGLATMAAPNRTPLFKAIAHYDRLRYAV